MTSGFHFGSVRVSRVAVAVAICAFVAAVFLPNPSAARQAAAGESMASPVRIILVRHAEKARGMGKDPPLTDEGRERAESLIFALAELEVDAVYTTEFRRTHQTVAPFLQERGIRPVKMKATQWKRLVRALRNRHNDESVLVVGHSFTLPQIIRQLGIREPVRSICQSYGDLLVITIDEMGKAHLERRHFGD